MMKYRFYFTDGLGHVVGAKDHEAAEDLDALEDAQILSKEGPIEVWQGERCVARVKKGGAAEAPTPAVMLPR